jgi:hypothetical protein
MTQVPPDAPLTARLGARLGPEAVASLLAIGVVVLVGAIIVLSPKGRPAAVGPTSALASPSATASASAPAASGSGSPAASSPVATSTPDSATARVVLEIVDRLIAGRAALAAAVSPRSPDAQVIGDRLRAINADLVALEPPLDELARSQADVAARIAAVSATTRQAITDTQRASITNVKAYRDGGRNVVDVMGPLVAIRLELAALAGKTTPGGSGPPSGSGQPTPSGTTP